MKSKQSSEKKKSENRFRIISRKKKTTRYLKSPQIQGKENSKLINFKSSERQLNHLDSSKISKF